MTQRKHFKQLVRERMKQSGERYAAARRGVLHSAAAPKTPHRPGLVSGATALRVLLAHRGLNYSEPMVFGLAGGIGIGVFSFYYEKADFASFFIAGRHCWHDHVVYLTRALTRLNQKPVVKEASTPRAAEKNLREMLDDHGPCVAWVDLALLPHRGLQHLQASGGGYHIITVYSVDSTAGTAQIGDLTDEPITISLADLTAARGRIKKDRYRLLAIAESGRPPELRSMVMDALQACHNGLGGADGVKSAKRNFSLDALATWAERLTSTKDKERWEHVFAPGHRFFNGLLYLHLWTEYAGTGGGLARPIMGEFLHEASRELREPALAKLGDRYAALGAQWSELADAALPDEVPQLTAAKKQLATYAELFNSGGTPDELADCWNSILKIEDQMKKSLPLTIAECGELRSRLRDYVVAIHSAECAADADMVGQIGR